MDIAKSFTFVTEDERWLEKIGIGVGLVLVSSILMPILVGILGFFILIGYCVRLIQNVRDGAPKPLPEWNRWGDDLVSGLKLAFAMLIYALPIFLFTIPMTVGAALTDQSRGGGEVIGWPLLLCGVCLMTLYGIAFTLFQPGITVAFARDESLRSALQLSDIWAWTRRNLGGVLIVTVVYIIASIVIGLAGAIVGVILCLVGLIITIPLATLYTYLVQSHLYGQLARQDPDVVLPRSAPVAPDVPPVVPPGVEPAEPAPPTAASTDPEMTPYTPSATVSYAPGEVVEPVVPPTVPPTVPPSAPPAMPPTEPAAEPPADLPPAAKPDEDPTVPPTL
jgi:hypothetical protein